MVQRDFVIGALHRLGGETVEEMTPSVDPGAMSLEQINDAASEIAAGLELGGRCVYDVGRLYRRLEERAFAPGVSPAAAALIIDRALAALPREPAADVAICLVSFMREDELQRLGRAGLLALRDAACLAPPEQSEDAVRTLDRELARRGAPACREVGGTWVIAEGAEPGALDAAHERIDRMHAQPLLKSALSGLAVVVVPVAERGADRGLLLEHLRTFAKREFDPALCRVLGQLHDNNVTMLEEARVMADAFEKNRWARRAHTARSLWRGIASKLRVGPEALAATE